LKSRFRRFERKLLGRNPRQEMNREAGQVVPPPLFSPCGEPGQSDGG
jgi:hypothetical protein